MDEINQFLNTRNLQKHEIIEDMHDWYMWYRS